MWDRAILKENAKNELRNSYWIPFLVGLTVYGISIVSYYIFYFASIFIYLFMFTTMTLAMATESYVAVIFIGLVSWVLYMAVVLAVYSFGFGPLSVGYKLHFTRAPYGDRDYKYLFWAFNAERYMKIVKVMFFTQLKIFLGSLVIVPGIIWSYSYRMVPYLIAENPDLTPSEAMEMSDRLTYGHKIDIFILDLSFIGWILLGLLCCCIGTLFLAPYIAATDAQLYFALRSLQGGIPYSTAGNGGGYNSAPYNGPGPDVGPQQADNPYGTNTPPPAPPENNPYDVPTPPPTMDPFESMAPPPPPIDPFASVSPPPEYRDYKPDMPPAEPEQEQDGNGDGQGPDA